MKWFIQFGVAAFILATSSCKQSATSSIAIADGNFGSVAFGERELSKIERSNVEATRKLITAINNKNMSQIEPLIHPDYTYWRVFKPEPIYKEQFVNEVLPNQFATVDANMNFSTSLLRRIWSLCKYTLKLLIGCPTATAAQQLTN